MSPPPPPEFRTAWRHRRTCCVSIWYDTIQQWPERIKKFLSASVLCDRASVCHAASSTWHRTLGRMLFKDSYWHFSFVFFLIVYSQVSAYAFCHDCVNKEMIVWTMMAVSTSTTYDKWFHRSFRMLPVMMIHPTSMTLRRWNQFTLLRLRMSGIRDSLENIYRSLRFEPGPSAPESSTLTTRLPNHLRSDLHTEPVYKTSLNSKQTETNVVSHMILASSVYLLDIYFCFCLCFGVARIFDVFWVFKRV